MVLRVLENFAGIGTQRMALNNLGIEHEVVGITEIDKFAIASYEAIHGKVNNLGDISMVEGTSVPDHDLFTYSFPCQDISTAGKQSGFEKGSGTRSGLLWECEKVIRAKKPKYLLMENVKNLVSKKFLPGFEEWLQALEYIGYTNYWQVLNAKDYGVPQNRERVFCVSILGEHDPYEFPTEETLGLRLKDILEDEVADKFYLPEEKTQQLSASLPKNYNEPVSDNEKVINPLKGKTEYGWHFEQQVYDEEGITRALKAGGGSGNIPKVIKANDVVIGASRGRDIENPSDRSVGNKKLQQRLELNKKGTSNTITSVQKDNLVVYPDLRIRKLTPKECWRLMGISDDDFAKAQAVNSNTQLYKQAGNAIVVNVLEGLFANMFH